MTPPSARSHRQQLFVVMTTALVVLTLVNPPYPREQWLQHAATVPALAVAFWAAKREWFSNAAMASALAFLALHAIAARWIYSCVPYERWCQACIGSGPAEWFGWRRNHFDRLVHFAFGGLALPMLAETWRYLGLRHRSAVWAAIIAATAIGALYEVFEWLLAIVAAPDMADLYNGQQGDAWDAQKDLAAALVGSVIGGLGLWVGMRGQAGFEKAI